MTFNFGLFDSFDLGTGTPGQLLAERLSFAIEAEKFGIDHYHVTEHHGTPLSVCPSPNIFLAALSQRTTSMRLGAMVYVLPSYNPLRLAEEIATLDNLTNGRLDVGIGSGISPYELAYFGVDGAEARDLYSESLSAITKALATGSMQHVGQHLRDYDVELSIRPVQEPHPPLWYASSNTRTAAWAGTHGVNFVGRWNSGEFIPAADAYWANWHENQSSLDRLNGPIEEPSVGLAATVVIGDSDAEARDRFFTANEVFKSRLVKLWHEHDDHKVDMIADSQATLDNGTAIVGSAETVLETILHQVETSDINFFEATLVFGDMSHAEGLENLHRFSELMPVIREFHETKRRAVVTAGTYAGSTPNEA